MNESEVNLLKVLAQFKWPESKPVSHRLYYREDGTLICYSMEDLPGNYIEIDPQTYARSPSNILVVNGKLKELDIIGMVTKLKPGTAGIPCSPQDISIVVDSDQPHVKWSIATNEP